MVSKILYFLIFVLFTISISIFIFNGYPPIAKSAEEIPENPINCNDEKRCLVFDNTLTVTETNGTEWKVHMIFNFTTNEVFAADNPINYKITATSSRENAVKGIFFIMGSERDDFSKIKEVPLNVHLKNAEQYGKLIPLEKKSSTLYSLEEDWFTPIEQKLILLGFVVRHDGKIDIIPEEHILSVYSHLSLLQAETNRQLLKNFQETEKTNNLISGLTWTGISLGFGFVGFELLMRARFKI